MSTILSNKKISLLDTHRKFILFHTIYAYISIQFSTGKKKNFNYCYSEIIDLHILSVAEPALNFIIITVAGITLRQFSSRENQVLLQVAKIKKVFENFISKYKRWLIPCHSENHLVVVRFIMLFKSSKWFIIAWNTRKFKYILKL